MLKRLICWIRGHSYCVVQVFSPDSRRIYCTCCARHFAMNDRVRVVVPWSDEIDRFYRENGHLLTGDSNAK